MLFASKHAEHLVTPDSARSRKRNNIERYALNIADNLPLIRTCQPVYEEATSILYGENIFDFDDQTHGTESYLVPGFNMSLPWCDFMTMYLFLSRIGSRNRLKIQYLRLGFYTQAFTTYPHERIANIWDGMEGGSGALVGDALEFLSQRHNVLRFEIQFGDTKRSRPIDGNEHAPSEFIDLFGYNRILPTRLQRFQGIKELRVITPKNIDFTVYKEDDISGEYVPEHPFFLETKEKMEGENLEREKELSYQKWWTAVKEITDTETETETEMSFLFDESCLDNRTKYGFENEPVDQLRGRNESARREKS